MAWGAWAASLQMFSAESVNIKSKLHGNFSGRQAFNIYSIKLPHPASSAEGEFPNGRTYLSRGPRSGGLGSIIAVRLALS